MNIFGIRLRPLLPLVIIVLGVFGFAVYRLTESPQTGYDEGILIQMADNFSRIGSFAIRTTPAEFRSGAFMTTAYPALMPVAVTSRLFGSSLLTARATALLFLFGFIICFYLVALRAYGRRNALISTALMATHASLYVYGKPLMGEIPGLLYLMLFLLGFDRLSRQPARPIPLVLATAFALGLAAVTKPIFLLALPAAALTLLVCRKRLPVTPASVIAATVAIAACFGIWFATQFFRTDDVASILQFYRDPYQIKDVAATVQANLMRFVTEATPAYVLGLFLVWAFSFFIRASKKQVTPVETFCVVFVLLVFSAYLRTPGFYRYFFLANAVIYLAFPRALEDLLRRIVARFPAWKAENVARDLALLICVLLIVAQGHRLTRGSYIATTYRSTQTAELTRYFDAAFDRRAEPYLYDVPEIVPFLRTARYSQWIEVSGGGVFSLGPSLNEALASRARFIILTGKRHQKERDMFDDYREIAHVGRYAVLERTDRTDQR